MRNAGLDHILLSMWHLVEEYFFRFWNIHTPLPLYLLGFSFFVIAELLNLYKKLKKAKSFTSVVAHGGTYLRFL